MVIWFVRCVYHLQWNRGHVPELLCDEKRMDQMPAIPCSLVQIAPIVLSVIHHHHNFIIVNCCSSMVNSFWKNVFGKRKSMLNRISSSTGLPIRITVLNVRYNDDIKCLNRKLSMTYVNIWMKLHDKLL